MSRAFSWSAFWIALCLTGCVDTIPLPGRVQTTSVSYARAYCYEVAYEKTDEAGRSADATMGALIGGPLVGMALGGMEDHKPLAAVFQQCLEKYGWHEVHAGDDDLSVRQ
jgi:hypothetical protein